MHRKLECQLLGKVAEAKDRGNLLVELEYRLRKTTADPPRKLRKSRR
jgi:hypothetical protein